MSLRLFKSKRRGIPSGKLQEVVLRGFSKGWNAIENDIAMSPDALVSAINVYRTAGKGQAVRFGSAFFANIEDYSPFDIVDITYFNDRLIAVTEGGHIVTIDSNGDLVLIWSAGHAGQLPSNPAGWGTTFDSVNFVPFKSRLIVHNGVDKPLEISNDYSVTYLQDTATGSNVNVPIGLYGATVQNYHCVAGIPGAPTTIYISSKGTSGTFPGDPAPNDAIAIDVGAYASAGASEIRGIAGFRNYLIVFFLTQSLPVRLGEYEDGIHTPSFPDSIPQMGLLGHRCITGIESDILFAGITGITSAKRNLFSGLVDAEFLSKEIEPAYIKAIGSLSVTEQLKDCFIVYDKLNKSLMLLNPTGRTFTYTYDDKLRYRAWSEFADLNWRCACTSFFGRVFAAEGKKIYQVGNAVFDGEDYHADKIGDNTYHWQPTTAYVVGDVATDNANGVTYYNNVNHTSGDSSFGADRLAHPTYWTVHAGLPIGFEMELPWIAGQSPMRSKILKYISGASKGTAAFFIDVFVDNLYKDADGTQIHDPALTLEMVGNDQGGFGYNDVGYGGGRRLGDPRLWKFPVKFKSIKFKIRGSATKPLEIVNISFLLKRLGFKR